VSIFNRYKDIEVPQGFIDMSHFTILLHYENRLVPLRVPNPLQLPRRGFCAIWPYEIKQALGLVDTMKELWITPICLIPRDMPMSLSEPIHFIQSSRLGGTMIIPATRLKADLSYDVFCEDFRTHFGTQLEPEELEQVQAHFREYDPNGDGVISKKEMEELIRHRVTERKLIIDARFEGVKKDPDATPDAILAAEEGKQQYMQHLTESAGKLMKMFEIMDADADGTLSYEEFVLAEAWWMRCTLNPQHAHLF
jgi:Ca2+-binding EF-hand superfamily protein